MRKPGQYLIRILAWPVRRPIAAFLLAAALAALAGFGVWRLQFDSSLQAMFSTGDPAAAAMTHVLKDFAAMDELVVLASLDEGQNDPSRLMDFARRLQAQVRKAPRLSKMTAQVSYQPDPQMESFIEHVIAPAGLYYLDDVSLQAARQRLTRQGMTQEIQRDQTLMATPGPAAGALAKALLRDPLHLHDFLMDRLAGAQPFRTAPASDALLSQDGRHLLILIRGQQSPSDLDFASAFTQAIEQAAAQANTDHLRLQFTGSYPIAAASEQSIRHDMIWSVIESVVFLLLLFLLAYRSPLKLFLLAFLPVALGIFLGFGICALLELKLSPMTAVLGAILAGMGIDYSIQYLACFERHRLRGALPEQAAINGLDDVGRALVAAWATSVIGFLAIGCSSVQALRDFALLGTIGLTGAFACAIFLLPVLLAMCDRRPTPIAPRQRRLRLDLTPWLVQLARRRRFFIAASLLVLIAAIGVVSATWGGEILPLESDLTVMHPRPNPALQAQNDIARDFGGAAGPLLIYLHADSPEDLTTLAHEVQHRLSSPAVKSAGITGAFGLATLLPDPAIARQRQLDLSAPAGQAEAERVTADFRALIADSIFDPRKYQSYEQFLHSLLTDMHPPQMSDLLAYPNLAQMVLARDAAPTAGQAPSSQPPPTEALTLVFARTPLEDRASRDAAVKAIRDAIGDLHGATLTGLSVLAYDSENTVRRELPRFLLAAAALTLLYLLLHFRRIVPAVLALLPGFFGILVLLAVLRMLGQRLNMVNLVALPLLIGIDVDYGIFIVSLATPRSSGSVEGKRDSSSLAGAASSGQAVLICAGATILGFGSLALTSVPAIRSLGIAVAAGILSCVAGCFFLLMPLLPAMQRVRRRRRGGNETDHAVTSPASKCAL